MRYLVSCLLLLFVWATPLQANTLLVVGDSLSAAYGIPQSEGWVSLLEQELEQRNSRLRVVNASISGETSSGGLSRLPRSEEHTSELQSRPHLVCRLLL